MGKTDERRPAEVFPPGEFIQEELEARGWTQEDFAAIIDKPLPTVNQIIKGKKAIIPEVAKRIAAAFGNSPQFWMNLETSWQLYNSEPTNEDQIRDTVKLYELLPIREMQRRGWIAQTQSPDELKRAIDIFFENKSLAKAARMSATSEEACAAATAWCHRSFLVAELVQADKFTRSKVPNLIKHLRPLFAEPEEVRRVPQMLAEYGIRFVVVEHLHGTKLDGACVSDSESRPVISLSLRYGRLDSFWFTLIHELAHIYHGDGQRCDAAVLESTPEDDTEIRANEFAGSTLVPSEQMESFILRTTPLYSTTKIENFARRMGVHPAIVIGQLKHRHEFDWNRFTRLHNRVDVRDIVKSAAMYDGWGQVAPVTNQAREL